MTGQSDEVLIRQAIENWAVWRDTGDWARFAGLWRPEGRMVATWFRGGYEDFIARSRASFGGGAMAHHVLGGTAVAIEGRRAVAQTRMQLMLRTGVEGVLCDITCVGRFVDLLAQDAAGWRFTLRNPVYEKDRLDSVEPGRTPMLDAGRLAAFPPGYRTLAYAQSALGMQVVDDLPGHAGPALDRLNERCGAWLNGAPVEQILD